MARASPKSDHKQQIYDHGCPISLMLKWLGVRRENVTLLETFRCCPYIVQLAANLIDDPDERIAYINQVSISQGARQTPLLVYATDPAEEKEHIINLIRTRIGLGEKIGVLFPQQRQAFGYATGVAQAGIDVENPKELDFTTDKPKFMPYHSAKGLTFDSIILPRFIKMAFGIFYSNEI